MLDVSHISSKDDTTQTFYTAGPGVWQTWRKPRGAKFAHIFCVGAGGGGAAGKGGAGSRVGGGGGASGGISSVFVPLFFLPDILYISVGSAGIGGASVNAISGSAGTSGSASIVAIAPSSASAVVVCYSPGGNPGQNTGVGSLRGTSTAAATLASASYLTLSIYQNYATVAGGSGTEVNYTALTTNLVTGGAGSNTAVGNTITGSTFLLTQNVFGGVTASSAGSTAGAGGNGYGMMRPFCGTGGAGGGAHTGGTGTNGRGGNGGNGWYGCGGGGGGTSITTAQGGRGGNGGDGIIMITTIY